MSAFLVSDDHITAICTFACDSVGVNYSSLWVNGVRRDARGQHRDMFRVLKQANLDSLTARYGDQPTKADARVGRLVISPLEVIKAIDCLTYQSCEVADWESTDAALTLHSIRNAAISKLPGYDAATYAIPAGTAEYRRSRAA